MPVIPGIGNRFPKNVKRLLLLAIIIKLVKTGVMNTEVHSHINLHIHIVIKTLVAIHKFISDHDYMVNIKI